MENKEQVLAFLEALVGLETIGFYQEKDEAVERPKSPHALTHLQAILGENAANCAYAARRMFKNQTYTTPAERLLLQDLAEYLARMARILFTELSVKES